MLILRLRLCLGGHKKIWEAPKGREKINQRRRGCRIEQRELCEALLYISVACSPLLMTFRD